MGKKKNANEAAFPNQEGPYTIYGLTKREYFAAMAMQGMLGGRTEYEEPRVTTEIAKYSVELADELLKQLE